MSARRPRCDNFSGVSDGAGTPPKSAWGRSSSVAPATCGGPGQSVALPRIAGASPLVIGHRRSPKNLPHPLQRILMICTNYRQNVLKTIRFEYPAYIPMTFHINSACWSHYDQTILQDLMEEHPFLFPDFKRQPEVHPLYGVHQRRNTPYLDPWGCLWRTMEDGITGSVHTHPLADWSDLARYTPPDPNVTDGLNSIDWPALRTSVQRQKLEGRLVSAGLPHGHTFLRLQDIRGYENLLLDMIDGEPRLSKLIQMVENFNYQYVMRWMELEPDLMNYPEDLGMQVGPMLSPAHFRRYIKPVYQQIMKPARERGCIVHMHSDGDIRTLVDDLVEGGVDVINLQDLVNGMDWIAEKLKGRVCIELDIDRQRITARGTPRDIEDLIRQEIKTLGGQRGGLMMVYGLYPGVPLDNVKALMDAMEKYATYYA